MNPRVLVALSGMALLFSCKKMSTVDPPVINNVTAIAPEGFNFATSKDVSLSVQLLTNDNKPLKDVLVNVYSKENMTNPLYTALTDESGKIISTLHIPSRMDSLVIDPAYVGLLRNAEAVIKNNTVNCIIGGSQVYGGDIVADPNGRVSGGVNNQKIAGSFGTTIVSYLGAYDNSGRPTNLTTPSDVITSEMLSFINTSLPEGKPVPTYHPDFLTSAAETNLNITKMADVWITFVHEGAGYYNTLGFYTYPTNNPPQKTTDIDTIKIVVPNASLYGSGGNMRSGDKVNIGRFGAGISIGFVLLQNAWNSSTKAVNTNATKFFADDILNNEGTNYKRHMVLLYDDKNKLFLHGFEDLQRDNGSSDNDFNDLIFYTTSNPVEAISTSNVNPIDKPVDSDGDGVTDVYDKFPKDAKRAYIQYFPSQDTWGTLSFEDLWPSTGDYDLNDLVVGYQYAIINNAQNKTVDLNGDFMIRGIGATKENGLGIQLPFTSDKISSISGQKLVANYITTNSNGTEAGQSKAIFVPFDDTKALIPQNLFVNNMLGQDFTKSDTAHVKISLGTPLAATDLGTAPFNPFLIINHQRGYEVHLPGNKPTDKANAALFGTDQDQTSVAKGKYYLSADNWPWALSFLESFDYPTEGNNISKAYNYFLPWASSGGVKNTDWYKNISGNRTANLIYTH